MTVVPAAVAPDNPGATANEGDTDEGDQDQGGAVLRQRTYTARRR